MDIDALLEEVSNASSGYKYIPAGTHRLKFHEYQWKDGKGHKKAVGPAFAFTVISSDNAAAPVGEVLSRLVKLNTKQDDEGKRKATLGKRKDEIVNTVKALLVAKGLKKAEDAFDFDEIKSDLAKVAKLNKLFEGAEIICHGTDVQVGAATFTNCVYSPCQK